MRMRRFPNMGGFGAENAFVWFSSGGRFNFNEEASRLIAAEGMRGIRMDYDENSDIFFLKLAKEAQTQIEWKDGDYVWFESRQIEKYLQDRDVQHGRLPLRFNPSYRHFTFKPDRRGRDNKVTEIEREGEIATTLSDETVNISKYVFAEFIVENEPAGRKSLYTILLKGDPGANLEREYFGNYFGRLGTHDPKGGFYGCRTQPIKLIVTRSYEVPSQSDAEVLARYVKVEEV
jgi:hypothetical protein